jgi:hypothetical protein
METNVKHRPYWILCDLAHTGLDALDWFYSQEQFIERAAQFGEVITAEELTAAYTEFRDAPREGRTFRIRL